MSDGIEPLKGRRVYLVLRDRIVSGALAAGERMPGEPSLAAEHGVSRVTLRRALDRLAEEGLITRKPGSGTFVRGGAVAGPIVSDFGRVYSHLVEMGSRTQVRLLAFAYGAPPPPVASALRLPDGARTQRSVRVRLLDDAPFSYLTTHVPEPVGLTYSEADLGRMPLLALLERSGVAIDRATQSITAALAGPDAAAALGVDVGAPLLSLTRVVFDAGGAGVEHLHALYRPDRYAFESDLVRTGRAGERHWASAAPRADNTDEGGKPTARQTISSRTITGSKRGAR